MLKRTAESGIMIGSVHGNHYISSLVESGGQEQGLQNLLCSFDCILIFNVQRLERLPRRFQDAYEPALVPAWP